MKTAVARVFTMSALLAVLGIGVYSWYRHSGSRIMGSQPRMSLPKQEQDLGNILPGSKQAVNFDISNKGNSRLFLNNLRSSCGCSPAEVAKSSLLPGERTSIKVKFSAPLQEGPVAHSISFNTNDPLAKEKTLVFRANIKLPINIRPYRLRFVRDLSKELESQYIELTPNKSSMLPRVKTSTNNSWLICENFKTLESSITYKISIVEKFIQGDYETGVIRFSVDGDEPFSVEYPVSYEKLAAQKIVPSMINLGFVEKNSINEISFIIKTDKPEIPTNAISFSNSDWKLLDSSVARASLMAKLSLKIQSPSKVGYSKLPIQIKTGDSSLTLIVTCHVND